MSSRISGIAIIGLIALGAGAWWVISTRNAQGNVGLADPGNQSITAAPVIASTPPTAAPSPASEVSGDAPSPEDSSNPAPASAGAPWPEAVLEFANQRDPDPALSRALEASTQTAIDATLDRTRHDLQSVTCRGANCQILSINRATGPGSGWPASVAAILRELGSRPVANPSTGTELKPNVQMVMTVSGEPPGNVAVIGFQ